MIVACPNCETKFNLPEDKIAPAGSKVKCSKCSHVFKVMPPPATPEEEVESLLESEAPAPDTDASSDFDDAFEEAMAEQQKNGGAKAPEGGDGLPEPEQGDDENLPDSDDLDDLFDEAGTDDELPTPAGFPDDDEAAGPDEAVSEPAGDDDLFDGSGSEPDAEETDSVFDGNEDELFSEEGAISEDDLFGDDSDDDKGSGSLNLDEPEEDDSLDLGGGLDLDSAPKKAKKAKKGKKSSGKGSKLLVVLLVLLGLLILALGGAVYFQAWKWVGIDASNIPLVGRFMTEEETTVAPGESPEKLVSKIELVNVLQYYDENEKEGTIFVVQGDAVNHFGTPKERIKVEVTLFDAQSRVLASQTLLCGNTLSKFQLKVQTREGIEEGLKSEVGVLSNNTFIRPGSSTPFMAVFFAPPEGVTEFEVKAVQAADPQ